MATEQPTVGPEPGLRERKKAQTRQQISDVATLMFLDLGFDKVRVADIAARAGVSEKTVYNYFPTKESLVFDQTDAQLAGSVAALSNRAPGVSPTRAYLEELKRQLRLLAGDDFTQTKALIPRFGRLIEETPALRAAWGDHRHRTVLALAEVLAADLGVDPHEPEPLTTARALASLTELSYDSISRNVIVAESADELITLIERDLERGARLLDTGAWSVALMIGGRRNAEQLREASRAAEHARRQVMSALREARRSWRASGGVLPAGGPERTATSTGRGRMRGRGQA